MNNVANVVEDGLCTSCGICAGACAKSAISFYYGKERNYPIVDNNKCSNCGICYKVCPGKGLKLNAISTKLFCDEDNVKKDLCSGYFVDCYTGHSNNENIRMHSATGGMVTQFLIWLLKKNIIDGAVVVRYKKENPFETEPFIATTEEEIWESRSSKYVVLSMDNVAEEIAHSDKSKIVVVGLPCQIQGWRQLADANKKVRESIIGFFAIYCSVNKTKHSLEYYPQRYNVDPSKVGRFAFRDDGCMGFMKFTDINGNEIKKIPYLSFWFGTHSFFANPRCSLCIDQLGELADISFGDIHIEPYSLDKIGTNSIIARSTHWNNLLKLCKEEGHITLDEVPIDIIKKSQTYTTIFKKGAGVKTNFLLRRLLGKNNPQYDYTFNGIIGFNNIVSEVCKATMRSVGRHRHLWWIIKMLDRNKD